MADPVLVFYHSGKYLYSESSELYSCCAPDWRPFLRDLAHRFPDEFKVIKLNFEAGFNGLGVDGEIRQTPLHSRYPVEVRILHGFDVIDEKELRFRLRNSSCSLKEGFRPLVSREDYHSSFNKVLQAIVQGGFYQLNLTMPFSGRYEGGTAGAFVRYHRVFRGDFHGMMPLEDGTLISMSPELFLEKRGEKLLSRPIKGTVEKAFGSDVQLMESEKEAAELAMIVDLLRSDLNSVADVRHSRVNFHRELLDLGDIWHSWSELEAESRMDLPEILYRMLPGASVSGCPKRRAVEHILALEPWCRGFYTGVFGWWRGDDARLCVLIRSFMLLSGGEIYYHSGGGIVHNSQLDREYRELLLKARKISLWAPLKNPFSS
ncbi:MAG: hypothetical protein B0D92_07515 [Spirochaeta sp. LUC14_002_19_P3]|nr:MAG: hypothetical protein B0D92_07515 [Spirochaeta sp. LUC14_002_19_P3]